MYPILRPGTPGDSEAVFDVSAAALADLMRRQNMPVNVWEDPSFLDWWWERSRPLYEHLALTCEAFWVAENEGGVIGYARSVLRDGVRQLTEFFVRPDQQADGLGRELLARVFRSDGARLRSIIATTDIRAQARYLKAGVYARFAIQFFRRVPEPQAFTADLQIVEAQPTPETVASLQAIDRVILGFTRDADHHFLLGEREGTLYFRQGELIGYSYKGKGIGPVALLYESDFRAVLAHIENEAAQAGSQSVGLAVPMVNRTAIDYLLERRFLIDDFVTLFMSDRPFGRFENYVSFNPPFFL